MEWKETVNILFKKQINENVTLKSRICEGETNLSISLNCPPNAATVRIDEITSSAMLPAFAYAFSSFSVKAAVICKIKRIKDFQLIFLFT